MIVLIEEIMNQRHRVVENPKCKRLPLSRLVRARHPSRKPFHPKM